MQFWASGFSAVKSVVACFPRVLSLVCSCLFTRFIQISDHNNNFESLDHLPLTNDQDAMAETGAKSTAKLTFFVNMESSIQKRWADEKVFEVDPPADGNKEANGKFMATFPYPYMNGRCHIGHTFSLSKLEVCGLSALAGALTITLLFVLVASLPLATLD